MIPSDLILFPGLRLLTSADWYVEVQDVTENGIVQWKFVDRETGLVDSESYTYGAPVDWVYRAWTLA